MIESGYVMTLYQPRWHGFAKWTVDLRESQADWGGIVRSTPMRSGFVRRHFYDVIEVPLADVEARSRRRSRAVAKQL